MKTLIIILLLVLTLVGTVYSQNTVSTNKVFYSGETLVYKVKWTVSYTHLDVYKRQILKKGKKHSGL